MLNGRGWDVTFDPRGALVELGQKVALDSIPSPAKTAIATKAGGEKITRVEIV